MSVHSGGPGAPHGVTGGPGGNNVSSSGYAPEAFDPDTYFVDPEEGRFPLVLVGATYFIGMLATALAFLSTGSFAWSAATMFSSGIIVPLALVLTPGLRGFFVTPQTARRNDTVSRELKAWQDDLAIEQMEADLRRKRMEEREERLRRVS